MLACKTQAACALAACKTLASLHSDSELVIMDSTRAAAESEAYASAIYWADDDLSLIHI